MSRTVDDVVRDLQTIACQGISTDHLKDRTAQRVRELAEEAGELATAEQRRATARAWSAWLDLMMSVRLPAAGGKSMLADVLDLEPGLRERLDAALTGRAPRHAPGCSADRHRHGRAGCLERGCDCAVPRA